jgi:hypothetical protein
MWEDTFLHTTCLTQSTAYKNKINILPYSNIYTVYSQSTMVMLFSCELFTLHADINKRDKNDRTTLSNG